MKNSNVEQRLENIEDILKMLLINSVLNNDTEDILRENIVNKFEALFSSLGLHNIRLNYIENEYYIFAETDERISLREIKSIAQQISGQMADTRFVFSFKKVHPKRKKSLEDAGISYHIHNGELKIFNRKEK